MEELDMFDNEVEEQVELIRFTRKTVFEFKVNTSEKDKFLHLVRSLSSDTFGVSVDSDNIRIKEYSGVSVFRVKASGSRKDLNIWKNILEISSEFLLEDVSVVYLKKVCKQ